MNKTIELNPHKRQKKYRVIGRFGFPQKCEILYSTEYKSMAEDFCWQYEGKHYDIFIETVWVPPPPGEAGNSE